MSKEHPLKVSINTAVEGKFSPSRWPDYNPEHEADKELAEKQYKAAWRWYNGLFRETTITAHGLAVAIWKGYAFAPVYYRNWRKKENFLQSGHIAFDFDTADERSSLDTLCEDFFYSQHGAFGYSTPSSTPDAPKSRMVYIFQNPITELERYENLYRAMLKLYYGKFLADPSTKDGARLFFGSKKCEVRGNWELLGDDDIDGMIEMWKEVVEHENKRDNSRLITVSPSVGGNLFSKVMSSILENISHAENGQRHHAISKNAFVIGGYVAGGYVGRAEAEQAIFSAIAAMSNLHDVGEKERTAVQCLEAGMKSPLILEQQANFVLDEV